MAHYWSAKTNAFYPEELHAAYRKANTLPNDIVKVTDDTFKVYSGTPPKNKIRGVSGDRSPCWIDMSNPHSDIKSRATDLLNEIRAYIMHEYVMMNIPIPKEYVEYQRGLKSVINGDTSDIPEKPSA